MNGVSTALSEGQKERVEERSQAPRRVNTKWCLGRRPVAPVTWGGAGGRAGSAAQVESLRVVDLNHAIVKPEEIQMAGTVCKNWVI